MHVPCWCGGLTFHAAVLGGSSIVSVPDAVAEVEAEMGLLVRLDATFDCGRRHSRAGRGVAARVLVGARERQIACWVRARRVVCMYAGWWQWQWQWQQE